MLYQYMAASDTQPTRQSLPHNKHEVISGGDIIFPVINTDNL